MSYRWLCPLQLSPFLHVPSQLSPFTLCSWMASSCISASSRSAYASSRASLGGRALLCQRAMAEVIFLLGPNNLQWNERTQTSTAVWVEALLTVRP